ncbi:putative lysophospholipase BODYGUARD 3 [Primulina tabacum]|uniref:putative lysophospholipase BODYGUARD 3 n=1 Tax=Primulina tabacum TaxID=48773 RepID=UPI003F5A80A0
MGTKDKIKPFFTSSGRFLNEISSFLVFTLLDILDFVLCYMYKMADFFMEAEFKSCYCWPEKEAITSYNGKIVVSEQRESRTLHLTWNKLQLEEISDTLYTRPSLLSDISKFSIKHSTKKLNRRAGAVRSTYTVNSTSVQMLQEKVTNPKQRFPIPRWSDCDCMTCTSWMTCSKNALFVKVDEPQENVQENVLFIHGFISSSAFWTETLYPNFSKDAKSKYRLLAVDLLGFGRSPKPNDSLYTLREHLEMIERSVLEPYNVKSFHIVAHSLGCILALALAVKHPASVKSLTLLAPPYFPAPKGEQPAQYTMRKVAPRRVWPLISFGASVACWYEHLGRTVCILLAKNHRLWDFLTKLITRNRIRTYLIEGFFCHTHTAAWHTLHNIICGAAAKMEGYLDEVNNTLKCDITIYHGEDDELIPVECSYNVKSRIPRSHVKIVENKDHITIVVGRQKTFARELEEIWKKACG